MSIPVAAGIGVLGGLIVSSWQGFKDPPWEGFFMGKFFRSILVGAAVGGILGYWGSLGGLLIDNLGILAFGIVAVERVLGEAYKGFLRKGSHAEYFILLRRMWVPEGFYPIKLLLGVGFLAGAFGLFRLLGWWAGRMVGNSENLFWPGLLVGCSGGLLVAIGGALKDSQFEGFLPLKFLRSPIVGVLAGLVFIHLTKSWFLLALAVVGGERAGVELYKTFLKRQVRGIHAAKPILHPQWYARRFYFAISFGISLAVCLLLLFFAV